ncbi:MAG TPA: hypothetical protein VFE41_30910 [Acetobacteraceae bacterium]|nr:hypothetical protein [Acetobacteraceae bacterium]
MRSQRVSRRGDQRFHRPVAFTWRRKRFRVRRADGPKRIHDEWWRRDAETLAMRDYFQIEDGRRFWLFRRGDGVGAETGDLSWFLHGIFQVCVILNVAWGFWLRFLRNLCA